MSLVLVLFLACIAICFFALLVDSGKVGFGCIIGFVSFLFAIMFAFMPIIKCEINSITPDIIDRKDFKVRVILDDQIYVSDLAETYNAVNEKIYVQETVYRNLLGIKNKIRIIKVNKE